MLCFQCRPCFPSSWQPACCLRNQGAVPSKSPPYPPSLQVWRERLGRQRALVEAGDLRQKLARGASAGGGSKALQDVELDEAALQALEEVTLCHQCLQTMRS